MVAAKKNKSKKRTDKVRLQSPESHYFKTTYKNSKMEGGPNNNGKLTGLKGYDPIIRKNVVFEEKKINK